MTKAYSIGQLAKMVGVSVSTLRRWDKEALLVPSIITEGGHRRYTEDAVLQILNKRFKASAGDSSSDTSVVIPVDKIGMFQGETAQDFADRALKESTKLGEKLIRYQEELEAVVTLQRLTSNPIMTSLLEKEFERIETHIGELTNDLSEVAVDVLYTINKHYSNDILFDTAQNDHTLIMGGTLAELVDYLLFKNPAREGLKVQAKAIHSKKMLKLSLDFSELLRRIDFYYTSAGVSLRAIARKKNYLNVD
jgi:DNA-binding transcriptional MerR regulator